MARNDPDTADPDKGINDSAKNRGRDLVVDHEAEQSARKHGDDAGTYEREIRKHKTAKDETDHKDNKIVHTEECLDRSQVFLFVVGGRKQIERCGRSAGGKQPVADPADDSEEGSGYRRRLYMDPVRKNEEKDRDRNEHQTQHQVHNIGTDFCGENVDDGADDCGRDQEGKHDAPLDRFPVFDGDIYGADAHHDDGEAHRFAVLHDQRKESHCDHGCSEAQCALDAGAGENDEHGEKYT